MARGKKSSGVTTALLVGGAGLGAYFLTRKASAAPLATTTPVSTIPGGGGGGGTTTTPPATTPPQNRNPPRGTKIFNPSTMKDPATAHSLANQIANTPDPSRAGMDDPTYQTLREYAADPSNGGWLMAFQDASGIDADGIYGPQTQAAFNFFFPG